MKITRVSITEKGENLILTNDLDKLDNLQLFILTKCPIMWPDLIKTIHNEFNRHAEDDRVAVAVERIANMGIVELQVIKVTEPIKKYAPLPPSKPEKEDIVYADRNKGLTKAVSGSIPLVCIYCGNIFYDAPKMSTIFCPYCLKSHYEEMNSVEFHVCDDMPKEADIYYINGIWFLRVTRGKQSGKIDIRSCPFCEKELH